VVATPRRRAAELLGPLVAPRSHFLELLIVFDVLSFDSLRLPNVVRRVIYAPGASSGEVVLVEQSRPDLLWPVDILLGADGNAVLSRRWRAFALGHRLRIGDHLVFCFCNIPRFYQILGEFFYFCFVCIDWKFTRI
jgi:hypothetical protein